ncbi:HAD-IB family phosphatase [Sphingomonas sp. ID1715]|nr:HAD-IB family phosphatase [Sphingomonas sp. ID1715]
MLSPQHHWSVFDLDRTLTRRPTYTGFLLFAACRLAPWRTLLVPAVLGSMLAYATGLLSRKRLKEIEHRLLLGRHVQADAIRQVARDFAARAEKGGFHADARARIRRERFEGRRVIVATAANSVYANALVAALGVHDVIATRSMWDKDVLIAAIDGENCYGPAKRDMLADHLRTCSIERQAVHIRFFSDHISDQPTFEWADEAIAINPSKRLRRLAQSRGWPILRWR